MSWKIDPSHTSIEFSVKHMVITTVRGSFGSFAGEIKIDDNAPSASSVQGSIDVASIDTGDKDRENHLKSPDFFDVENYPQIAFRSKRVQPAGKDEFKVTGDLTIKDVTREITWNVTDNGRAKDPWGNQRRALSASTHISRKDFGITWNVALESGGWLVGDKVNINAEVQLVEVPETETVPA
ncbi:MAG: YceI family protein [Caldilineales bacterium]|nr:YceI family protein [Caldilineales bacterium]